MKTIAKHFIRESPYQYWIKRLEIFPPTANLISKTRNK